MLNQKLWGRGPYSLLHRKVWRTLGVMERTWGRKSIEPSWILLLLFEWWTFWDFLSCFSNMEQHNLRILPGVESVVEKRTWSIKASSLSLLSAHGACFLPTLCPGQARITHSQERWCKRAAERLCDTLGSHPRTNVKCSTYFKSVFKDVFVCCSLYNQWNIIWS